VIASIPLDLDLSGVNDPATLFSREFAASPLSDFEVVDDPAATKNAPSQWSFDASNFRVAQTNAINGGTTAVNANKPGTYLMLRTTPSRPAVADLILRTELQSDGDQGIGLVFRYLDPANFYFFLANKNKNYRLLAKKVGGTFQQIALDTTRSFTVGAVTRLKIVAEGAALQVFVDDAAALAAHDTSLTQPGRVGFMAFLNPTAFFYGIELVAL
jgi:hypothetical protein